MKIIIIRPKDHVCRCSPCGRGTRCMFCNWLVAFCKIKDTNVENLVAIPYKKPYIEMYEDIKSGIINGDFSEEQVISFFEETSGELYRDCKACENGEELLPVAFAVRKGSNKQI